MKKFLLSAVWVMPISILFAQGPDTLWTQTFGTENDDRAYCVQQTLDGGYIITGTTDPVADTDPSDLFLVKTDVDGKEVWSRTFGGTGMDGGYHVEQTSNGGYIIAGCSDSDFYLVKTDSGGGLAWTRRYGGLGKDEAYGLDQTVEGGYIIAGVYDPAEPEDSADIYILLVDSIGDTIWSRKIGGIGMDKAYSVKQTFDGGYIITGSIEVVDSAMVKIFLLKISSVGGIEWTKSYGTSNKDLAFAVDQTSDGGYIIAGMSDSDLCLIRIDENGTKLWSQQYGGERYDEAHSIQQIMNGGYIIAGYTNSSSDYSDYDFYLIETDSMGNANWQATYGGINDDWGYSVDQTSDGGYIIAGYSASFGAGNNDAYLIKTKPASAIVEQTIINNKTYSLRNNPAREQAVFTMNMPYDGIIELRIYDALGRIVDVPISGMRAPGNYEITWGRGMNAGVYFYTFSSPWQNEQGKLVLIR